MTDHLFLAALGILAATLLFRAVSMLFRLAALAVVIGVLMLLFFHGDPERKICEPGALFSCTKLGDPGGLKCTPCWPPGPLGINSLLRDPVPDGSR